MNEPIDMAGPRDRCGPDCESFVHKWEMWWDATFFRHEPAMIETPASRDAYRKWIGAKSRNMLSKADRAGIRFEQIERNDWLESIYGINRSKLIRSGGPMRPIYMQRWSASRVPELCSDHRNLWIGAFNLDRALVAYCNLIVTHELAIINSILAHAGAMPDGAMNAMIDHLVKLAIDDGTIRFTNYTTLACPKGLAHFKRSVGFHPIPIDRRTHEWRQSLRSSNDS